MAKFVFKKKKRVFVVKPESSMIIPDKNGLPTFHRIPGRVETIITSDGRFETEDKELIARIRRDPQFNTSEIKEITAEDQAAIDIHTRKRKEAEEEIKKAKEKLKTLE